MNDGWLACDNWAPTDANRDTPDCQHITSQTHVYQNNSFGLFNIVLFHAKMFGFFPEQTVTTKVNYTGFHMGQQKRYTNVIRIRISEYFQYRIQWFNMVRLAWMPELRHKVTSDYIFFSRNVKCLELFYRRFLFFMKKWNVMAHLLVQSDVRLKDQLNLPRLQLVPGTAWVWWRGHGDER